MEDARWDAARRAAQECPLILESVNLERAFNGDCNMLGKLRDLVVKLAKDDVRHEVERGWARNTCDSDMTAANRRESIHQKLQKLRPGRSSSLSAVRAADGEITTDPDRIAKELAKHWSCTFISSR